MFERMAASIVIPFVLKQLAKFQSQIDWVKVQNDLVASIEKLIPGTAFDSVISSLVVELLNGVKYVLGDTTQLSAILNSLAVGNWVAAETSLKAAVTEAWNKGVVSPVPSPTAKMAMEPTVASAPVV